MELTKEELLKRLGLSEAQIPRFRGIFEEGDRIIVRTRTGGGNRHDYMEANATLARHPQYVGDEDDEFDTTYALFYFKFEGNNPCQ